MADKTTTEPSVPEKLTALRDCAEYIRNDEAYVLALKEIETLESRLTEPTVEFTLKELREMFPADYWIRIDQTALDEPAMNREIVYRVTISIDKLAEDFEGTTLSEAMAQVYKWYAEQGKES